jgi:hypothetical protein
VTVSRRLARPNAIALAILVAANVLTAGGALAANSPQGDTAVAWPSSWREYTLADGSSIIDDEGEPSISPPNIDIASDGSELPSVYTAFDGSNAFCRDTA